ncbi:DUF4917 family protein [uncultured Psychromonas sp.]|uniref:DUF4917 family protein n=1 Tax=uncultured Psychromonas sp. TaxID=173974 RepID=UPI002615D416|nr:DUF4917 family protein [uncultured Psychromonas sp.]
MIEIKQWEDIKAEFSDTLIVGNGGSIAISSDFSYNKLYQWGKNNRYIKENAQGIFEHFSADKRDFERVLYKLNQADYVNKKVKITDSECKKVRKAYTDVRRSLIDTVIGLHPEQASVEKDIHLIKQYLLNFKIIFSLNYDLLVYWAAQERIDVTDLFLDGFSLKDNVKNSTSLLFDETSFATIAGKNVQLYFPHGNLLLYNTKSDDEKKITITSFPRSAW